MPIKRCPWVNESNLLYVQYHDKEWGRPVHDDQTHFELLTLEGAQAGLSWETILKKRENYRKAFANFDVHKVARFSPSKQEKLLTNPGIVRNKLKIASAISNAKAFIQVQKEYGRFDKYIWGFVENKVKINDFAELSDYPTKTDLSDTISKDLKKRGFKFVGSTIIYAYLQAAGIVNDHTRDCFIRIRAQQKWYVYVIRCNDHSLYTGITNNVSQRFNDHCAQNAKSAKYLRGRGPLSLVYSEMIGTKSKALKVELAFKRLNADQKKQLIKQLVENEKNAIRLGQLV